jgi:hypothetical protein
VTDFAEAFHARFVSCCFVGDIFGTLGLAYFLFARQ